METTELLPAYAVLFVCLGNICRSPAAEAVMKSVLGKRGLLNYVHVDSAGTADYHIGRPADERMIRAGTLRGHAFTHRARQITAHDLSTYNLVLAMDRQNLRDIRKLTTDPILAANVSLFAPHCNVSGCEEVPDPYYGGAEGFAHVLDLLEEGCENLALKLEHVLQQDVTKRPAY